MKPQSHLTNTIYYLDISSMATDHINLLRPRRFSPALIDTVKESFRLPSRPHADASLPHSPAITRPRSQCQAAEIPRCVRQFAPQLIETSRRCRRCGDLSPATRPADKTDITPSTRSVYASTNPCEKSGDSASGLETTVGDDAISFEFNGADRKATVSAMSRRESMTADGRAQALEETRREYDRSQQRREQDALMAAFPNFNPAIYGGIEHFNYRESSEDEPYQVAQTTGQHVLRRRDSEINWFTQIHRDQAIKMAEAAAVETKLDEIHGNGDPGELVTSGDESEDTHEDNSYETATDDHPPAAPMWVTRRAQSSGDSFPPLPHRDSLGDFLMPHIPETHVIPYMDSRSVTETASANTYGLHLSPAVIRESKPPADIGFQNVGSEVKPRALAVSPPMAGQDLNFRRCESPKIVRASPADPFSLDGLMSSDPAGLWKGFCVASNDADLTRSSICRDRDTKTTPEASTLWSPRVAPSLPGQQADAHDKLPATTWVSQRDADDKQGVDGVSVDLDSKQHCDKQAKLRQQKIAEEFSDKFVTQVYNYLSLGYPAMARDFDAELSKISHIPIEELRIDDDDNKTDNDREKIGPADMKKQIRTPRWHALKKYVTEWASQHPDLDFNGLDPVEWGMGERKGSWAV